MIEKDVKAIMKQVAVYTVSIWKRMWKTPGYLAIFFLTPVLLILLSGMNEKEDAQIRAAVCLDIPMEETKTEAGAADQKTIFLQEIAERLLEKEGAVAFYICDSEEEVKRQVAAKQAQCGYVFPADLFERLDEGRYTRSIKSYESPQTSLHTICDEVLFAEIFTVYEEMTFGRQISSYFHLEGTAEGFGKEEGGQIADRAEELLEKYRNNGSTFQFTYEDYRTDEVKQNGETAQTTKLEEGTGKDGIVPVRGIMALMIYIGALCGTLDALEDEAAGRVQRLHKKWVFQILTILIPAFVMGVIALLVFGVTGNLKGIGEEIGGMVFYQVLLTVYCCILKKIWRREEQFCGVMPVLILSAAVICPVFLDLSVFLPVLKVMEKIYPLSNYLRM